MSGRPMYDRAWKALEAAHEACFRHPDRDTLGMSHGPFSGVNEVLGMVASMEATIANLSVFVGRLADALKPFSFCDAETPPEGVAVADWRAAVLAARAALAKAEASHG